MASDGKLRVFFSINEKNRLLFSSVQCSFDRICRFESGDTEVSLANEISEYNLPFLL